MYYNQSTVIIVMFEDDKIAKEIRSACNPKELKALDKKMKNIDAKVWDAHCKGIMKIGNMAKVRRHLDFTV